MQQTAQCISTPGGAWRCHWRNIWTVPHMAQGGLVTLGTHATITTGTHKQGCFMSVRTTPGPAPMNSAYCKRQCQKNYQCNFAYRHHQKLSIHLRLINLFGFYVWGQRGPQRSLLVPLPFSRQAPAPVSVLSPVAGRPQVPGVPRLPSWCSRHMKQGQAHSQGLLQVQTAHWLRQSPATNHQLNTA